MKQETPMTPARLLARLYIIKAIEDAKLLADPSNISVFDSWYDWVEAKDIYLDIYMKEATRAK